MSMVYEFQQEMEYSRERLPTIRSNSNSISNQDLELTNNWQRDFYKERLYDLFASNGKQK